MLGFSKSFEIYFFCSLHSSIINRQKEYSFVTRAKCKEVLVVHSFG
uniref:Uncharacterized protein n=1 Tax=Rhizophora mucronata TaxID=61149 RepID=A0A2P2QB49_RHIMU